MSFSRMRPSLVLVALLGVLAAPIVIALRMMADQPRSSANRSRSSAKRASAMGTGFDGQRSYRYLAEQCNIGPRISGTAGNKILQDRMVDHFRDMGAQVEVQAFQARHPLTADPVEMANVVARWFPERARRVVLGAHFDTRPRPDSEPNPRNRSLPFLGANDGASGIAVLMELAHLMPDLKTKVGVDFVAFDAEELVYGDIGEYFLGSRHFAEQYRVRSAREGYQYIAAIVVDMVGDKRLQIYPDHLSATHAPKLVQEVWSIARRQRARAFRNGRGHDIRDDHVPLIEVGIPAIDIIDFDYPHWHRASDTKDKCSAASLAQVGRVLAEWLRSK